MSRWLRGDLTGRTPRLDRCIPVHRDLSLPFNREEFCDEVKARRKTIEEVAPMDSGTLLDGRIALRPTGEFAFRPPRRPAARFRRPRWGTRHRQECRETPEYPARRESPAALRTLPRQSAVGHARACQLELGAGGEYEPGPPVRLLGAPDARRGPSERPLEETDGVLQVEPPYVGPPQEVQAGSSSALEYQSQSLFGLRVSRGRRSTSTRMAVPRTMGAFSQP